MASLQSRISDLITAIGADMKKHHGVSSSVSPATLTPASTTHEYHITALANAVMIANPTGSMDSGQSLVIRIKDNGSARGISWGSYYRGVGLTLPNTTVAGKYTYFGIKYNSDDTKCDVIAIAQEA
jgi:hypothetical protein